jgi:hypothetical protein
MNVSGNGIGREDRVHTLDEGIITSRSVLDDLVRGNIGGEENGGRRSDEASGEDHRERMMMKTFLARQKNERCM